jgi:anti-sigma B factor antagonist
MQIKKEVKPGYWVVQPIGELDASSAIKMDQVIKDSIKDENYTFLINCRGLSYISSAGVGVFVSYLEELEKKDGEFIFYNMKESVYNVFQTLGLHKILKIVNSKQEAKSLLNES